MSPSLTNGKATTPSPLKIKKDSHFIINPTSPPSSSSSSSSSAASVTTSAAKPPLPQPVIIYTQSPKIIHTNPRDFMALVQKLTGQSQSDSESDHPPPPPKPEPPPPANLNKKRTRVSAATSEDMDSSSVVTYENCTGTVVRNVQIKSCFPSPQTTAFYCPSPINPCFNNLNIPFLSPNPGDLFSSPPQPFYSNYHDPFLLMNNMRTSISSSSSPFEGMKEFREF